MTKRKNHLSQTVGLMIKTRPFLRARAAVYGVFFFATVGFYTTFILWLGASNDTLAQLLIIAAALVIVLLARRYLGRYLTYSGHAPHTQAMVAAVKGETLPKGHHQIEEYTRLVDKRYPEVGRLVQLDRLILRTLREAADLARNTNQPLVAQAKPPKLRKVRRLMHNLALRGFGDAVFAYAIYVGKPNVWRSARDGVALFAESAEKFTKSAIRVYIVGLFTWLLFAVPMMLATWSIFRWAESHGLPTLIIVSTGLLAAAWVLKTAFYNPPAMAWLFSVFLRRLDEVTEADEAWAERLEANSKRYRELNDRAKAFSQPPSGTRAAPKPAAAAPPEKVDIPPVEPTQDDASESDSSSDQ